MHRHSFKNLFYIFLEFSIRVSLFALKSACLVTFCRCFGEIITLQFPRRRNNAIRMEHVRRDSSRRSRTLGKVTSAADQYKTSRNVRTAKFSGSLRFILLPENKDLHFMIIASSQENSPTAHEHRHLFGRCGRLSIVKFGRGRTSRQVDGRWGAEFGMQITKVYRWIQTVRTAIHNLLKI